MGIDRIGLEHPGSWVAGYLGIWYLNTSAIKTPTSNTLSGFAILGPDTFANHFMIYPLYRQSRRLSNDRFETKNILQ